MGIELFQIRKLIILVILFSALKLKSQDTIVGKDALVFAVITDTHIGKPGNTEGMSTIIDAINKRPTLDFVVHTGDVSDFGLMDQLIESKRQMDRLNKPYFIVPGNHDTGWSGSGGLAFSSIFKDDKFLAEVKNYILIGLNTGPYTRHAGGFVTNAQLRWLDSLVKVIPATKPVIFFSHIPLIPDNTNNCQLVLDHLKKMNIVASFCGHGHSNKIVDCNGLPAIMTRTAQKRQGTLGFNIMTIKNNSIEAKQVLTGVTNDTVWAQLPFTDLQKFRASVTPLPDYKNTGFTIASPIWIRQDNGNIVSTPAVLKQNLLVGNLDGVFKSYALKDGKAQWEFKTRQAILSSPAVNNNSVVFGSSDSTIYCLNTQTGKINWKMAVDGAVVSSPVIKDGQVFIGASDLYYRCIDLKTGRLVWKSELLAGFPPGKATIANDKIIFGTWNKTLYALNITTGTTIWKWVNADKTHYYSPAISTPVVIKDKVYIVAPDEMIHILHLQTGIVLQEVKGHRVRESFGVTAEQDMVVAKTMQDTVIAWNVTGKEPKIVMSISAGFGIDYTFSDVIIKNQTAFFGTTFGRLYAIDLQQKKVRWMYQFAKGMVNSPTLVPGNKVLVTCADGTISLFNTL